MKLTFLSIVLAFTLILCSVFCKKDHGAATPPPRNVQFQLYTTHDFSSAGDEMIDFTMIIHSGMQDLWDSALPPMKVKDIPGVANKIVVEKQVPGNNTGELLVGFLYTIEGVGQSWNLDTAKAGETFKVIAYDFN